MSKKRGPARMGRREFLAAGVAGGVGLMAAARGAELPKGGTMKGPLICVFSKHLQFLDYAELAKTCRKIGADGVDLTVREGGHVTPDKIATDLPAAVDAIRSEGLAIPMITTRLNTGSDPDARRILESASKLGIPFARIGGLMYDGASGIAEQLGRFAEGLRELARIAEDCNIVLGYHNHSGPRNVGGPIWDLCKMIESIGSKCLGSNLDAGHVVVEGAFGAYETNVRLIAPHVRMMAIKDFVWSGRKPEWAPLGTGLVPVAEILTIVREAGFAKSDGIGPMSLHFEYKVANNNAMIEEVRKAVAWLRGELPKAGFA